MENPFKKIIKTPEQFAKEKEKKHEEALKMHEKYTEAEKEAIEAVKEEDLDNWNKRHNSRESYGTTPEEQEKIQKASKKLQRFTNIHNKISGNETTREQIGHGFFNGKRNEAATKGADVVRDRILEKAEDQLKEEEGVDWDNEK